VLERPSPSTLLPEVPKLIAARIAVHQTAVGTMVTSESWDRQRAAEVPRPTLAQTYKERERESGEVHNLAAAAARQEPRQGVKGRSNCDGRRFYRKQNMS